MIVNHQLNVQRACTWSGMGSGKTVSTLLWRDANNHGTSAYVVAPPYGGTKLFMRRIAETVGANKNQSVPQLYETVSRAFNRNRILIVDEAHRLLPNDRRANPVGLEILRDLHDMTHCALALISTQRFDDDLRKSSYQYEQVLGRIGMPIRLPRRISQGSWMPIVKQYIDRPSEKLQALCDRIANEMGRLGILVETMKVASRLASKARTEIDEEHIFRAVALRHQMMGETQYAAK
jgi:DNA transposition AAA+ family ATPase